MPVAEYKINGVVTDKESKPIKDIRVIRQAYYDSSDTLYTSADGKFYVKFREEDRCARLTIEDIDGEANGGEFRPVERNVVFTDEDLVKKGRRNSENKYAKTIGIILRTIDDDFDIEYGVPRATF